MKKIINIAVVAHVDTGKSTLVDAILNQSGVFGEEYNTQTQIMDSDDIEKERGITIYSKNCSVMYKDTKINVVDTPGHADFGGEVERIMKTVDTVILLVDSVDGPMPQTRFVLSKALERGMRPILFINKIDKPAARPDEVIDEAFDLFADLGATNEQLDFPIIYGIARQGKAMMEPDQESDSIAPLFDLILSHVAPFEGNMEDNLQLQISSLAYDDYIGRLGIGRVNKGSIKAGQAVSVSKRDGTIVNGKISKLFINEGLGKVEVAEAQYGDIVTIAGIADISIGETIGVQGKVEPMDMIDLEEATLSMNFLVNDSPFAGKAKESKYITSRHLYDRLQKELQTNIGLKVEPIDGVEGYKVSGRGELHLSILLENMRREGYELGVSKPEVLIKEENGVKLEPYENLLLSVPDEYSGAVIQALNERKGMLTNMSSENGYTKIEFNIPTRGVIGFRSNFITLTKGEGIMVRSFDSYKDFVGTLSTRQRGVHISMKDGASMAYSLWKLSERGDMMIDPATDVYVGMIIGINNKSGDLNVNPCENKKLTNTRSSGADDAISLRPPIKLSLEEALEFIEADELVELTPVSIRLRKKYLDEKDRKRFAKAGTL